MGERTTTDVSIYPRYCCKKKEKKKQLPKSALKHNYGIAVTVHTSEQRLCDWCWCHVMCVPKSSKLGVEASLYCSYTDIYKSGDRIIG